MRLSSSAAVGPAAALPSVAFLFLGETLLIPHLWPIAEALAQAAPDLAIHIWVATSAHERLLAPWAAAWPNMSLRRAPGFRDLPDLPPGANPPLPPKLPMLARLAPLLRSSAVTVCAEQTSLWIPFLAPWLGLRFVKTSHGVGSMSARDDRRRRAATRMLVPSERERTTYLARGFDPARVVATGYVKASFRQRTSAAALFATDRPILLYTPHWQRHRSSWWAWGREIVAFLAAQDRWNVILAPHQRLFEHDPEAAAVLEAVAHLPHMHCDRQSFAMVDGSYTAAADLYLGDSSSQVVEYLARPRPCLFLNPQKIDWQATDDHDFWRCGDVVDRLSDLEDALATASNRHPIYAATQQSFAQSSLGDTSDQAPKNCAKTILSLAQR
ncbi:hypothetical protein Q4F19_05830 [Sphingomonas sp. BIUV-7]|uniref:CDP-Glycerol:Poly(Glycerophosphate) glycerophosphotransferase n=1 Tax=Sphingomonas natans TaxID=3063330 RepID=A0ABT8Y835_9SPHN|nr:hypothetical protein [Sphingomonas sp. BIUV-7]MDO6413894.1 hypothetical protein [Sphingomonas sp. BIUV-7]